MKLKLIRYLILLAASIVFLSGCSEEQLLENEGRHNEALTSLTVTTYSPGETRNGTSAEDEIQSLRLIAYEYNGTSYLRQQANTYHTAAETKVGDGTYQVTLTVPQGLTLRIFIIANEKAAWNLGNMAMDATSLQNTVINHLGADTELNIQPPFVMFTESGTVESSDYRVQQLSLTRTIAKVSLSLQANFAEVAGLNGGDIRIGKVELKRLPKTQQLAPGFPYPDNAEVNLCNTGAGYFTLTPTVDAGNRVTGFTTEDHRKLLFYVPEYLISNKAYYSFIQISGEYTPLGSAASLPVAYRIPLGNGVQQLYEGPNPPAVGQLSEHDLTITRNTHYELDATIRTLGATDGILLYVKAQPWMEGETVESSNPGAPYLNVSNMEITLTDTAVKRIYFWTNQPEKGVGIKATAKYQNNEVVPLSDVFEVTFYFTNTSQTNGYIEIAARNTIVSGKYFIYLDAGGLVRDLWISVNTTG